MPRILVVDDEQGFRESLDFALTGEGMEVETAATVPQAIGIGRRFRPHVLIADWIVGTSRGLEIARVLSGENAGLRTIMITGYDAAALELAAAGERIHAIIEKPFDLDDLIESLHAALGPETGPD